MVSFNPTLAHSPGSRARNILLLLFAFFPFTLAAPIRDSSTPSNWLACLTALLILSAICLFAFKLLFVRHRKITNFRGPPAPLVRGQYAHRTLKLFKFPAYTTCKRRKSCKAGFLIGLFGSPSFEILSKPREFTLVYPSADTSGSSQKHDVSGDTTTTYKTKSSAFSTGSVILFSDRAPWHIQGHGKMPSRLSASLTKNTISRFLPLQLSFDFGRVRRKKRRIEISAPGEDLAWPHNHLEHATLRLVTLYTEPETSLPLCEAIPGFPSLALATHGFAVAHLNHSYPFPISPLPYLPACHVDDEDQILGVSPPDKSIDHPYSNALLTLAKPGRQSSRRASLSPNLSVIEEAYHVSIPDISGPTSEQADSTSLIHETTKRPPVIFSAYNTLKRREKLRSSSLRNRRSPPLGPSPLRSMILPDVAEDDYFDTKHIAVDGIKDCSALKRNSTQYHRIGLGLPSIKLSPPKKERIMLQDSNEISRGSTGNRESMLDFLRELAEETREWDESIVLDKGFRTMIQRSQAIPGCTSLENVHVKCSTPKVPPGSGDRNKTPPKFVSFWLEDSPSP